ncbi:hypothetical protein VTL71DRAFT_4677 [Oculimacula yallundae]|uniref:T6SS Phospholipase effector Tle1-like catalytic domain-containing protein n=1 Tax=Oculimacula yallundae TaxID=86028 RepID=A0ABR4C2K5_9HELO
MTPKPLSRKTTIVGELLYPNKRLIVCCDGTQNSADGKGQPLTNVAKIARCVSDEDTWTSNTFIQIVHYQPGVGTGTSRSVNNRDAAVGRGLSKGIRAAYSFICMNWSSLKDEIVLIGFSRGAFTVRCVAQFINDVGLLTKSGLRHLPKLFKAWSHLNIGNSKQVQEFKDWCDELKGWRELVKETVFIKACAVWDTVKAVDSSHYPAVGEIVPKNVKLAVQALALGEKRKLFSPMKWKLSEDSEDQKLNQVWFAGNHSDVGGGNSDMTLANITLAWMIGQLTNQIHFSHDTLWSITTTREWSKPSAANDDEDLEDENNADLEHCKVVATAPISKDLLRSKDGLRSILMRIGGWGSRNPEDDQIHYSVHILLYLGIASYTKVTRLDDSHLSAAIPKDAENKFEAEILERWAKHILCAHINLKQARNMAETITPDNPLYQERLRGSMKENASYNAEIPIAAILSAFGQLKQNNKSGELNEIFKSLQIQSHSPHARKKTPWLPQRTKKATFEFRRYGDVSTTTEAVSEASLRVQFDEYSPKPTLVFSRTFPLLMGRCHALPLPGPTSKVERCAQFVAKIF